MNLARDAVELLAAMVRIDSANRWRVLGCTYCRSPVVG
jgi:hypothetical protein